MYYSEDLTFRKNTGKNDYTYIHPGSRFSDLEGLKRVSEEGARMGYTGKQVIHPDQVPVVRQAFSPSPERVKWATGLIKAFHEHQKSGKVSVIGDRLIDDGTKVKKMINFCEIGCFCV